MKLVRQGISVSDSSSVLEIDRVLNVFLTTHEILHEVFISHLNKSLTNGRGSSILRLDAGDF